MATWILSGCGASSGGTQTAFTGGPAPSTSPSPTSTPTTSPTPPVPPGPLEFINRRVTGGTNFNPAQSYDAGAQSADLNADGRADLVVVSESGLQVFLGNADGTLQTAKNYAVGSFPVALALGDVNGDQRLDAVVPNFSPTSGRITVAFGNGDGSFGAPAAYSTNGNSTTRVALGDVDGDGDLDAVAVNSGGGAGTVLLRNTGNGVFQNAGTTISPVRPGNLLFLPLRRDQTAPDLIMADGANLRILLNNNGVFSAGDTVALANSSTHLLAVDLNADQRPEIVSSSSVGLEFFAQTGQGGLTPLAALPSGPAISVVAGDFDDNGLVDLATVSDTSVSVGLSTGNGNYTAQTFANQGKGFVALVAADFTGDGKPDLGLVDGAANLVGVSRNLGAEGFELLPTYAVPNPIGLWSQAEDLNGDLMPDLVAITDSFTSLLLGRSDGGLAVPAASTFASQTFTQAQTASAVGDINNDNRPDLLISNARGGPVQVFLASGAEGNFTLKGVIDETPNGMTANPIGLTLADYTGDGNLDVAFGDVFLNGTWMATGNGDGTFTAASTVAGLWPFTTGSGGSTWVQSADFNRDGIVDLVASAGDGTATLYNNYNFNGFFLPEPGVPLGNTSRRFVTKDLNQDNIPDIVSAGADGSVFVSLGTGQDFPFLGTPASLGLSGVQDLQVADFDGDGKLDLATTNGTSIRILKGNGDGTFESTATATNWSAGSGVAGLSAVDIRGDGKFDLVFLDGSGTSAHVMRHR
ncbi:MAG: VCBS repeat-containing protein [Candidatus Eremiobacteraeota bacterium]|nr:VCBS repeat-containing protein [Candidatus Eremiobacteraeota bacterium]MCW5872617.1 VCBS repeat-containing protein [Candidatus Eremiobacteraeota bacterium]